MQTALEEARDTLVRCEGNLIAAGRYLVDVLAATEQGRDMEKDLDLDPETLAEAAEALADVTRARLHLLKIFAKI